MKKLYLLMSLMVSMGAVSAACLQAQSKFEILESCEGEGCGCTRQPVTNKKFVVYAKMDKKSQVLGRFEAATKAQAGKLRTKVVKAGKARVTEVNNPKTSLKVGDVVTHVFNAGEGITEVKLKDKWVQFSQEEAKLKIVEEPVFEPWLEITVGNTHGYTDGFPFEGCLE